MLYIDESGSPFSFNEHDNFVLGGLAIHEGSVWRIGNELDQIADKYSQHLSTPIAFHATDLRNKKNDFISVSRSIRNKILDEVFDAVASYSFPEAVAFGTILDKSRFQNPDQALRDTFQDICQRFNTLLHRQYIAGYPSKGLLLIDCAHEKRYRKLTNDFRINGTRFGYIHNIVDIPYFASRYDTRMLQIADFIAYAIFRYYESNDRSYFDKILHMFDRRSPNHHPDGLKHLIDNSVNCQCEACSWR